MRTIDLDSLTSLGGGGSNGIVPASTSTSQRSSTLDVLTYNVFLRPKPVGVGDANECRAREIGKELAKRADELDIVVLNETFAKPPVDELVEHLGERYPYRILRKPAGRLFRTNGGVSLLSRHPIRAVYTETFDTCAYSDCLATKGFVHAIVELSETERINVIATHLDAGDNGVDRRARERQLDTIREYMARRNLGEKWPTLMMGDLNVDGLRGPVAVPNRANSDSEYHAMLDTLAEGCENCLDGANGPTDVVPARHGPWEYGAEQTGDFNTMNCLSQSLSPCLSPNDHNHWKKRSRLDYILLYDGPADTPTHREMQVRRARSLSFADDACRTNYLSDHQAVRAEFVTPTHPPTETVEQTPERKSFTQRDTPLSQP